MVFSPTNDHAGAMTETPHQTPPPQGPPPSSGPPPGWNTENLKDYRLLRRSRTDRAPSPAPVAIAPPSHSGSSYCEIW